MSMLDWNTYRKQVLAGFGEIAKMSPDTVKAATGVKTSRLTNARTGEKTVPHASERPKLSEKGLLTPDNCLVTLIDLQPQMLFRVGNFDQQTVISLNVLLEGDARLQRPGGGLITTLDRANPAPGRSAATPAALTRC